MSAIRELALAKATGGGGGSDLSENYVELDFSNAGGELSSFNGYQTDSTSSIMGMRYYTRKITLNKVYELSQSAFASCVHLETAEIPDTTNIGKSAFAGCTSLASIKLPSAVSIGGSAFGGCTALKYVYIGPNCTSIASGAFGGVPITCKVECGFAEGAVSGFPANAGFAGSVANLDITYNVAEPSEQ